MLDYHGRLIDWINNIWRLIVLFSLFSAFPKGKKEVLSPRSSFSCHIVSTYGNWMKRYRFRLQLRGKMNKTHILESSDLKEPWWHSVTVSHHADFLGLFIAFMQLFGFSVDVLHASSAYRKSIIAIINKCASDQFVDANPPNQSINQSMTQFLI